MPGLRRCPGLSSEILWRVVDGLGSPDRAVASGVRLRRAWVSRTPDHDLLNVVYELAGHPGALGYRVEVDLLLDPASPSGPRLAAWVRTEARHIIEELAVPPPDRLWPPPPAGRGGVRWWGAGAALPEQRGSRRPYARA